MMPEDSLTNITKLRCSLIAFLPMLKKKLTEKPIILPIRRYLVAIILMQLVLEIHMKGRLRGHLVSLLFLNRVGSAAQGRMKRVGQFGIVKCTRKPLILTTDKYLCLQNRYL